MNNREDITPLAIGHFTVGWTYREDGEWYATAANEGRTTLGPFKQMGDASDALIKSTYLMEHTLGDGSYLLLVTQEPRNTHYDPDSIHGYVTWFTVDNVDGEAVSWEVRDGAIKINGWSGVGTVLNAEAKGAAMLEAAQQAQQALAALEVTA